MGISEQKLETKFSSNFDEINCCLFWLQIFGQEAAPTKNNCNAKTRLYFATAHRNNTSVWCFSRKNRQEELSQKPKPANDNVQMASNTTRAKKNNHFNLLLHSCS